MIEYDPVKQPASALPHCIADATEEIIVFVEGGDKPDIKRCER